MEIWITFTVLRFLLLIISIVETQLRNQEILTLLIEGKKKRYVFSSYTSLY